MRSRRKRLPWLKLIGLGLLVWLIVSRVELRDSLEVVEGAGRVDLGPGRSAENAFLEAEGPLLVEATPREDEAGRGYVVRNREGEVLSVDASLVGPDGPLVLRPGLRSTLKAADLRQLVVAFLLYGPVVPLLAWRWGILLAADGTSVPAAGVLRLTWIGLFFNNVVPGGAGGDLVKSYELGRYADRRSEAFGTVVADRLVGLLVLILLSIGAGLATRQSARVALVAGVVGLAIVVGAYLYESRPIRMLVTRASRIRRLDLGAHLARLDGTLRRMRSRPVSLAAAMGVSLGCQGLAMVSIFVAARALGLSSATFGDILRTAPIAWVASAIPISPGGLGVIELAFQELAHRQGYASLAQGFLLGALARLINLGWSLPGLAVWLRSR